MRVFLCIIPFLSWDPIVGYVWKELSMSGQGRRATEMVAAREREPSQWTKILSAGACGFKPGKGPASSLAPAGKICECPRLDRRVLTSRNVLRKTGHII